MACMKMPDIKSMQGCDAQITVWRREKNNFTREILPVLCRWRRRSDRKLTGAGFTVNDGVTIIVPYISGLNISTGDLIALGAHELDIGFAEYQYILIDSGGDFMYDKNGYKLIFNKNGELMRDSDLRSKLGPEIITVQRVSYNLSGHGEHLRIEGL